MKKFMFTAIAMVAFMGSSMANTTENESTVFFKNTPVGCLAASVGVQLKGTELGLDQDLIDELVWAAFNSCMVAIEG